MHRQCAATCRSCDNRFCSGCVHLHGCPTDLIARDPDEDRPSPTKTDDSYEVLPDPTHTVCLFLYSALPSVSANYPTLLHMWHAFHQVRGKTMRGILIDPGAARGLIGSETLRILIDEVVKPNGLEKLIKWKKSKHTFTGISPKAESSLGMVVMPIGLIGLATSNYVADVIGGDASLCPGLVPLKSLIQLGCCILFAYFDNGDGVLGIWNDDTKQWSAQRLHLTESGHYLLRIDNYNTKPDHILDKSIQRATAPLSSTAEATLRPPRRQRDEPLDLFCGVIQCLPDSDVQADSQVFQ